LGNWWLRSPGNNPNNAGIVNNDGNVNNNNNNVNNTNIGARPDLPLRPQALMPDTKQKFVLSALKVKEFCSRPAN
jgi:hypothetical protein